MEYPRLETATLADVSDRYYFAVQCQLCHRRIRLSLVTLRTRLGDSYPLSRIRPRLRCTSCLSKRLTITFLAPDQAVGNLRALFLEKAV